MRDKERLIVKKYSQIDGIDFNKTYVHIIKFTTIRTIIAIRLATELEIYQMNVKSEFLNGELQEDIYMD